MMLQLFLLNEIIIEFIFGISIRSSHKVIKNADFTEKDGNIIKHENLLSHMKDA